MPAKASGPEACPRARQRIFVAFISPIGVFAAYAGEQSGFFEPTESRLEGSQPRAGPLLSMLRDVRSALVAWRSAEPNRSSTASSAERDHDSASAASPQRGHGMEAAVARKLAREVDLAIARLEGREPEKDLVSIICHDLKDPLASIVMGVGYLKKTAATEGGEGQAGRRVIDAIGRSADRMSQVINDFHDLSHLSRGTLELDARLCDVADTLRLGIAPFSRQASERSIELRFEASETPLFARCDPARLLQIVSKLVGNAIKFTPSGGRIVVRVDGTPPSADAPSAPPERGRNDAEASSGRGANADVSVTVFDSGRGIPAELLPEIFDHAANARRSPRDGPGLGLAIAKGLVEAQGGSIRVESRVGQGSTFVFTLPRVSAS